MKLSKKLIMSFLSAAWLLILFTVPAGAADCTCQNGKPHDRYSHQTEWVTTDTTHEKICLTCITNGHAEDCAQVIVTASAKHTYGSSFLSGSKLVHECSACGYSEEVPCDHANATWVSRSDTLGREEYTTTDDRCIMWCSDCNTLVKTKKHKWGYKCENTIFPENGHEKYCTDCKYTSKVSEKHTYKTTYKKQSGTKTPVISDWKSPTIRHTVTKTCKYCKYSTSDLEKHTFKSNTCTRCKLKRTVLKAPTGVKGKRVGAIKKTKTKVSPSWFWNGSRWFYHKGGISTNYHYTVQASWKKVKNAAGYVYSFDYKCIKTGDYVSDTFGNNYGENDFTRKTKITVKFAPTKKIKSTTLYVAAVSKDGFIGKVRKVKLNIK